MHVVAVLSLDKVVGFELTTPGQVFGSARALSGSDDALYAVRVCGPGHSVRVSAAGAELFAVTPPFGLPDLLTADTIVVPAHDSPTEVAPEVIDVLRQAHAEGIRIASICTGAEILAAAGLLDGLDAATHWRHASRLSTRYPEVRFDASALYVDRGGILTGAGVAAGVDLCLHIIRRDHGAAVAAAAARRLVMAPRGRGGQARFIRADDEIVDGGSLVDLMRWMRDRIDRPLTLAVIAERARLSVRTLHRRFREQTGSTPMQWLWRQRVRCAQELLEGTALSIEEVARRSGFGGAPALRQHFRRQLATTPTTYRRQFSSTGIPTSR